MSETTNLSIRIDRTLKEEAERIFNALGMNLTTAITVFVRQAVRQEKIPFEISLGTDKDEKPYQVYSEGLSRPDPSCSFVAEGPGAEYGKNITIEEAIKASERIWQNSIQNGTDKMTMDTINPEISADRSERKACVMLQNKTTSKR